MKPSIFLEHLLRAAEQTGRALPDLLTEAQSLGLTHVECDLSLLDDQTIRDALRAARMGVSGVCAFLDYRQTDLTRETEHLLELAREVNAGCVMPIPVLLREGEDRDSLRRVMADGIARVCERAEAYDLPVVLEDFDSPRAPFGRLEELAWFLEQVPALGCTFDSGNFLIHGQDVLAAYEVLRPRIRHVHLKDRLDSPRYGDDATPASDGRLYYPCPAGSGLLPSEQVVRRLAQDGYAGACVLEHYGASDQRGCMRREAAWLCALLAECDANSGGAVC